MLTNFDEYYLLLLNNCHIQSVHIVSPDENNFGFVRQFYKTYFAYPLFRILLSFPHTAFS
jgi:hypothetical protein